MMTKKEIKEIFRVNKVQLGSGTIDLIEDQLKREVHKMVERAKYGKFKRITPETFHFVKQDYGMESGPRKLTK